MTRLFGLLALAGALTISGAAVAQDRPEPGPLAEIGEGLWRAAPSCWDCHGNMGNGRQEDPRSPIGADFREMALSVEQVAEVIRCGRPGTPMPSFGRKPYEGRNPCYGTTAEDLGDAVPPTGTETLNARQIDALAQFIVYQFEGRGPATQEECHAFYGADASSCKRWPTAAEAGN